MIRYIRICNTWRWYWSYHDSEWFLRSRILWRRSRQYGRNVELWINFWEDRRIGSWWYFGTLFTWWSIERVAWKSAGSCAPSANDCIQISSRVYGRWKSFPPRDDWLRVSRENPMKSRQSLLRRRVDSREKTGKKVVYSLTSTRKAEIGFSI